MIRLQRLRAKMIPSPRVQRQNLYAILNFGLKNGMHIPVYPILDDTLSKTTPSTRRGGQLFQLTSLLPDNTYQLKKTGGHVMLKASSCY